MYGVVDDFRMCFCCVFLQNKREEKATEEKEMQSEEADDNKPEADDIAQSADLAGKTSHDTQEVQQVEQAQDTAGQNDNQQQVYKTA